MIVRAQNGQPTVAERGGDGRGAELLPAQLVAADDYLGEAKDIAASAVRGWHDRRQSTEALPYSSPCKELT